MESEQCTVSVIAQLMNLNNVNLPFQSSPGPIRVLSDDYLQKTASIGLHRSLSSFQGSRTKKQSLSSHNDCVVASKRSLEEPKNVQNHLIVVNRAKSGIGIKKSSNRRQITSDFRFAKKQPPLSLLKTSANPNVVFPYTDDDQETNPNGSNHLEEENSRFLSSSCADYSSPSPISVLEPCLSDNSEESTKSDVHGGLHGNLEFLKSESEEMNSEVSGMMVSSDEDEENTEELIEEDRRQMMELFGVQGNRDFSYIVDALDEAGFYGNETMIFEKWYSEELPISPIIFEILEKKFGEQKTWERWERKLLFDRMNVGLRDILHHQSFRSNSRQLRTMFEFWQMREVVEDELWTFLIIEEKVKVKETQMKVEEKVLSANEGVKWLDLHDEIDLIVAEIETSLFRELEEELVC